MLKAIFLDFYGTLVEDDDIFIQDICRKVSASAQGGVSPREVGELWQKRYLSLCRSCNGDSFKSQKEIETLSLQDTIAHVKSNAEAADLSSEIISYWQKPLVYPETLSVLSGLRLPLLILSNIDNNDIGLALTHTGLSALPYLTSETVRSYKPRPELFQAGLEYFHIRPAEALHVGDSYSSDIEGAHALGIPTVWMNRSAQTSYKIAHDYQVHNLRQLADLVENFIN